MRSLILALALAGGAMAQSGAPEAMLRAAMDKESVDGDLKAAIEQYKKIVASKGASREVVAKALVRLGACYERQGDAEARKAYERVVREFGDQADAVRQAQARLAAGHVAAGSGLTVRRVWAGPGVDDSGTISPDGRYLSFTSWGNGDLAVRDLATGENRLLTHLPSHAGYVSYSIWSPDGKRLAYDFCAFKAKGDNGAREVRIINLDGSGMRTVYRKNESNEYTRPKGWSSDGKRILVKEENRLFWIEESGGATRTVRTGLTDWVEISPDRRYIAFIDRKEHTRANVYLMTADGGGEVRLSTSPAAEYPVGWMPDGKHLLFASFRAGSLGLWAMPMADGKPQGPAVMLKQEIFAGRVLPLGVTRSGALYYEGITSVTDIYTASMDPTTGRVTSAPVALPLPRSSSNRLPTWSGDGRRIFYEFAPITSQNAQPVRELFAVSIDSGADQRIGIKLDGGGGYCWAGDGESMLAMTWRKPRYDLSRMATTGESTRLADGISDTASRMMEGKGDGLGCSGDGKIVAFTDLAAEVVKVRNLESGSETNIYQSASNRVWGGPFVSRDGSQVAFRTRQEGPSIALVVVPSAGGPTRELARVTMPARFQQYHGVTWSPDGHYVYFLKAADGTAPYELFRAPAAGGREESTGLKAADLRDINISPDGTHVAFSIGPIRQPEVWAIENFLPPGK